MRAHSKLRAGVAAALRGRGYLVIPYPSTGHTGPGVTDIIAVAPPGGIFVAIECKTQADKPKANDPRWLRQQRFMQEVERSGGIAVWGYSVGEILVKMDAELSQRCMAT